MKLELCNISKAFGQKSILKQVSLTVGSGEIFSLVGPNGAGKTTILRTILGIYAPDQGSVLYNGEPISEAIKSQIGFVLENFYLYKNMTAYENVELFYRLYNAPIEKSKMKAAINQALELVNLQKDKEREITFFSQGMKQRLCLARAIVTEPKLLILDEPLKGLDVDGKWEIREIIKNLAKQGCTIFMNSHDMFEVEKLSTKIAIIRDGEILEEDTVNSLRKKYNLVQGEPLEELYKKIICR